MTEENLTKEQEILEAVSNLQLCNVPELKQTLLKMYCDAMRSPIDYDLESRQELTTSFEYLYHFLDSVE